MTWKLLSICSAPAGIFILFLCHLSIEKALKAKVQEITGKTPPKTHNLIYLLKLSQFDPREVIKDFIGELSDVSIPARCPEDIGEIQHRFNKEVAENYLQRTKEAFQWIRDSITS